MISDGMEQAFATFLAESRELLGQMETMLLGIEREAPDTETINAMFRAAHTIKGSAGMFGLDGIVAFTHVAESVLDRVRAGSITLDSELASVYLECGDHIGKLVDAVAADTEPDASTQAAGAQLLVRLNVQLGETAPSGAALPEPAHEHKHAQQDDGMGLRVASGCWRISLRFKPSVLRDGMDPLAFIRYLATQGKVEGMFVVAAAMPVPEDMDPEDCYLGFEIAFKTVIDKQAIERAFEFVRDDCTLRIVPPNSLMNEYLRLIEEPPEKDIRLGEMLIQCGTLTQKELDEALRIQRQSAASADGKQRPIGEILVDEKLVPPQVVEAALAKQGAVKENKAVEARSIRVDADKLDQLIDRIGELTMAGASTELVAKKAGLPELLESASVLARLVEEVRDSALTLRMVQIGATFSRFHRVVRDVSKELGKDIRLEIDGGETELDKTVVEKIGDPLMHLVRNSMDHGIEPAAVRIAAGKPTQAVVRLNACHDSGSILIEVTDDGGGLKRDRILKKAIERGLITNDETPSDEDIFQLVFAPGFSTADQVTGLSGRGVGMDVVKRNITALRGSVAIDSVEGVGATVRIRLPLTLAIIDGFLVRVGRSAFVIPLEWVEQCIELTHGSGTERYLNLRGEVLPYIHLRELFEVEGEAERRESVVVVRYAGRKAEFVVDELLGEFQTVIKPLCRLFAQLRGIGGSTILGSGQVALILDVPALVAQVQEAADETTSRARAAKRQNGLGPARRREANVERAGHPAYQSNRGDQPCN
ncbi:MAG: chemotaxis protein CheA [Burkholderiales bacterium]